MMPLLFVSAAFGACPFLGAWIQRRRENRETVREAEQYTREATS